MSPLQPPLNAAARWRFAPGYGFTAALLLLSRNGRTLAQATLLPADHEAFRGWARRVTWLPGHAPLSVTLTLPASNGDFPMRLDDAPVAAQLRQFGDQFGRYHIEMIGADGTVLARAVMDADTFARFIGDGCDVLTAVEQGGLAAQACEGSA